MHEHTCKGENHNIKIDVDNRICAKGYLSGWISSKVDIVKISFSYVPIYQINEFLILNVVLVKLDWLLKFNNKKYKYEEKYTESNN